jgi:hypothetical protein
MRKVLLVGAGNIGGRHLQGLRLVQEPLEIIVFDPSEDSLQKAHDAFMQVKSEHIFKGRLSMLADIPKDEHFDIAIIATSSAVRRSVTETILNHNSVRYLVLEKFLFQSLKDFGIIADLLQQKGVKAWVNCPRRLFPFYQELKDNLSKEKGPIEFHFSGTDWGLACNSIHRIDLFAFLTGQSDLKLSFDGLLNDIKTSKRDGYIEFHGRIEAQTARGDKMIVTSFEDGDAPNLQNINTPRRRYVISEKKKFLFESKSETDWNWEKKEFKMPFQSQLTNVFVEQILETGTCDLTTYSNSAVYHKLLLRGLLDHMSEIQNKTVDICPIT